MKKHGWFWCSVGMAAGAACLPAPGRAQVTESGMREVHFDIPAQSLSGALVQFGLQSRIAIAFPERMVAGKRNRRVRGAGRPSDVLRRLLDGSGLTFAFADARSVRIRPLERQRPRGKRPASPAVEAAVEDGSVRELPARDIVVTAQKRPQDILDVPLSITVIGGDTLERTGGSRSEQYLRSVAGAAYAGIIGNSAITMRGISTSLYNSNQQGTTEILLDDLPSLNRYFSRFSSDMRLVDVERVELLRGPQGTLFGSGALGGAIRIINNKPDASGFAASAQAGISSTRGGETSHDLRAMVNLPIVADRLALRVVGYDIREGGFVDNVVRDEKDVNYIRSTGIRAMLGFTPTDRLSVTAWAWHQRDRTGGDFVSFLDRDDGSRYQSGSIGPEDAANDRATLFNLTARYDLASVDLLSSTSLVKRQNRTARDYTTFWQNQVQFDGPVSDTIATRTRTFVQELRAAWQGGGPIEGVAGIFYLDQRVDVDFRRIMTGLGAAKGFPDDTLSLLHIVPYTREAALFGEATLHLTDRLSVTAGARWFRNTLRFASERTGYLGGEPTPPRKRNESAITPKFALTFKATPDVSAYLQIANGYRTGQNNFVGLRDPETGYLPSSSYGPDDLWNYEIGVRTRDWMGHRLSAAAFYISWKNIQLTRRQSITTYTENAGDAVSRGIELELEGRPFDHVRYGLSAAYIDARLTRVSAGIPIRLGDLPGAPRWSASAFLELGAKLGSDRLGTLRINHRYVGSRDAGLEAPLVAQAERTAAYRVTDIALRLEAPHDAIELFVRNAGNDSAALGIRELASTPAGAIRQTPRTIGLQLSHNF